MSEKECLKAKLKEVIQGMKIIDTHEHLCPEEDHVRKDFNFYNLFIPYIQCDLYSAGMPKKWLLKLPEGEKEIEECWKDISPLWEYVKLGSYARPLLIALKKFWNINDISSENYKEIGEIIRKTNTKGLYKRILVDTCNIEYVLNQHDEYSCEEPFMKGSIQVTDRYTSEHSVKMFIEEYGRKATLDDFCDYIKDEMKSGKEAGAILAKFHGMLFIGTPDRNKALEEFEKIKNDDSFQATTALSLYISDVILSFLPELDLVAAIHTGVWDNICNKSPELLFPVVEKHPDVVFDIYHMGMPYVRECGFLGKNYHNAYLNLCWSHIVSPEMTINALGEWLDYIPLNKVLGFGGDYVSNPENVWGHLEIARDNFAEVFARKIKNGVMDFDSAVNIVQMWMYDNPKRVYKL